MCLVKHSDRRPRHQLRLYDIQELLFLIANEWLDGRVHNCLPFHKNKVSETTHNITAEEINLQNSVRPSTEKCFCGFNLSGLFGIIGRKQEWKYKENKLYENTAGN